MAYIVCADTYEDSHVCGWLHLCADPGLLGQEPSFTGGASREGARQRRRLGGGRDCRTVTPFVAATRWDGLRPCYVGHIMWQSRHPRCGNSHLTSVGPLLFAAVFVFVFAVRCRRPSRFVFAGEDRASGRGPGPSRRATFSMGQAR